MIAMPPTLGRAQNDVVNDQSSPSFNVFGVVLKFLSTPEQSQSETALLSGMLGIGAVIPLHSHEDPEVLYFQKGSVEIYTELNGWINVGLGDTVTIPGDTKHALRNASGEPATILTVTGRDLYSFFRELAKPLTDQVAPAAPSPQDLQRLFEAASKYKYWVANPMENAAIGIEL